jgi:cysteine-rich repeat protein
MYSFDLGNINAINSALITHDENGETQENTLNLNLSGDFNLDSTSEVNVSGKGYRGASRWYQNGHGPGTLNGFCAATYGGEGYDRSNEVVIDNVYGSIKNPVDIGSSSYSCGSSSRNGGGAIKIFVNGDSNIDGNVLANGLATSSGGSVWFYVNGIFSGAGRISSGAKLEAITNTYDHGGGGRTAIFYGDNNFTGRLESYGGSHTINSTGFSAGAGTIYLKDNDEVDGKLIIKNGYPGVGTQASAVTPQCSGLMDQTECQELTLSYIEIGEDGIFEVNENSILNIIDSNIQASIEDGRETNGGDKPVELRNSGTVNFLDHNNNVINDYTLSDAFIFNQNARDGIVNGAGNTLTLENAGLSTFNTSGDNGEPSQYAWNLNNIIANGNSILTHSANDEFHGISDADRDAQIQHHSLNLNLTGDLTLNDDSEINADGKGFVGNSIANSSVAHGGGVYCYDEAGCNARINEPYGSIDNPMQVGLGYQQVAYVTNRAFQGGGAIKIKANNINTNINTSISVDAPTFWYAWYGNLYSAGVRGTGGSILLEANKLNIQGDLTSRANEEVHIDDCRYQTGSGGRIALYYTDDTSFIDEDKINISSDYANQGSYIYKSSCPASGTIYIEDEDSNYNKLLINNNGNETDLTQYAVPTELNRVTTPLYTPSMDPSNQNMTFSEIEIRENGKLEIPAGATLTLPNNGTEITGDSTNKGTLVNRGTVIFPQSTYTVDPVGEFLDIFNLENATLEGVENLTLQNGASLHHSADASLDVLENLTIGDQSTVELADYDLNNPLELNNVLIQNGGTLTHANNNDTQSSILNLITNNFTVDTGGEVNVDGKGFAAGQGSGGTSVYGYGGSYGGQGENNPIVNYGEEHNPVDLGSGGYAGAGGGLIKIQSDNLVVNGEITAKGEADNAGAGSGGSIVLTAVNSNDGFQGTGMINADGGIDSNNGGNGGGGRIAVFYQDTDISGNHFLVPGNGSITYNDNNSITMTANDPVGGSRVGQGQAYNGTLYLSTPDHYEIRYFVNDSTPLADTLTTEAGVANQIQVGLMDNNIPGHPFILTGERDFIFSGANSSPNGTEPICEDKDKNPIEFGNPTTLILKEGLATQEATSITNTEMTLYRAEGNAVDNDISIDVTDGSIDSWTTSNAGFDIEDFDLDVQVDPTTPDESQTTIDTLVNPEQVNNNVDIVVTPRDTFGNQIVQTGATIILNLAGANVGATLSAVQEVVDGITNFVTYTANYLASVIGEDIIRGTINSNVIIQDGDGTIDGNYHQLITGLTAEHLEVRYENPVNTFNDNLTTVAGEMKTITIFARDSSDNIDLAYNGLKNIQLTGPNNAPDGTEPIAQDDTGNYIAITGSNSISLDFHQGVATTKVYLFRAETISLDANDGSINSNGSPNYDLDVQVDPAGIDYAESLLEVDQTNVEPNDLVNITITTFDEYQNQLNNGGEVVEVNNTGTNTFSNIALTDNNDGTYSSVAPFHTPTSEGEDLITGTVSGHDVSQDNDGTSDGTFHLIIAALPRHFEITGNSTQVAGSSQVITITTMKSDGTVDTTYSGNHNLTFSGATVSALNNSPTIADNSSTAINFGNTTNLVFNNGIASAEMILYQEETAEIETTDGNINTYGSPNYDLDVVVSSANACRGNLGATPNPVVENIQVSLSLDNITDIYGNAITTGGDNPTLNITGANPTNLIVADNNDGTYSSNYTPTNVGTDIFSGNLGTNCNLNSVNITVLTGSDPACGTNATTYAYNETNYSGTFCQIGTSNPLTPNFPNQGASVNWTCEFNNRTANCQADREDPIPPTCGTNATTYAYNETNYSGTFCQIGTSNPLTPNFPNQGGNTSWACENDGLTVPCQADRGNDPASPACGTNATTYTYDETNYSGTFCQIGTSNPLTPNFPNQGEVIGWTCEFNNRTANCQADRENENIDNDDREVDLYKLTEVDCNSLNLKVELDNFPDDDKFDFKVYIKNLDTKEEFILKLKSVKVSHDKTTLFIDNLQEGIEYEFKVAASEKDKSDYTNSQKKQTKTLVCTTTIPTKAHCGSNAKNYSVDDSKFTGTFCQTGTTNDSPVFPSQGASVSWTCNYQFYSVTCTASREQKNQSKSICGNDKLEYGEDCDDGNLENGDGCDINCEAEVIELPVCGEAAKTYKNQAIQFEGTFCQIGTSNPLTPNFPNQGESTSWVCENDGEIIKCEAKKRNPLPLLGLLGLLGLFAIPFIKRKKEKFWGVVFDNTTRQPLKQTVVTLINTQTKQSLTSTITDEQGRFGFLISEPANYSLTIQKKGYQMDITKDNDLVYGKVYTKPEDFNPDIPIELSIAAKSQDVSFNGIPKTIILKKIGDILTWAIFIVGAVWSIYATIKHPHWINYTVLVIYALSIFFLIKTNTRHYGSIISKATRQPLPFTILELHKHNQRQYFAITNKQGRYYLLADNGAYDLKVKGQPIDGDRFEKEGKIMVTKGMVKKNVIV